MPKTKISEFSATPGNNTDIDGINIAEGCAPSGINDAIRELMSQLKDFQAGTAGDSFNGPVGTTTAAAGAFTTLSATGATTLSSTLAFNNTASVPTATAFAFQPTSNAIAFGTANTERMRINSDGNVGIQNTGPSSYSAVNADNLVVGPNSGSNGITVVSGTTGTGNLAFADGIGTGGATDYAGLVQYDHNADNMNFFTGATERMRLNSSGLTLNGGTANGVAYLNGSKVLTTGSALTFDGATLKSQYFNVQDFAASNDFVLAFKTNAGTQVGYVGVVSSANNLSLTSTNSLIFSPSNTEQARLTSTGLGIGTSSPAYKLDVQTSAGRFQVQNYGAGSVLLYSNGALAYNAATTRHEWQVAGSSLMQLEASGNLGIGTSSPGYKVSAVVTSGADAFFADGNGQSYSGFRIRAGAGGQQWAFRGGATTMALTDVTAGVDRVQIDSSGNLGIGVTPSASWTGGANLQIGLGAVYSNSSLGAYDVSYNSVRTASNSYVYAQTGLNATRLQQRDGAFNFFTAASGTAGNAITFTQAMTLDASGNLGVGTTSPTAKINVYESGSGDATVRIGNAQNALTTDVGKQGSTSYGATSAGDSFLYSSGTLSIMSDNGGGIIKFSAGGNTERARITSGGDFVINGTSTLNTNAKLSVWNTTGSGDARGIATGYGTTNGQFRLIYLNSAADALNFDNGTNNATLTSGGTWTNASDARLKKNIQTIKYGLETVLAAQPKSFNRVDVDGEYIGFIAQELRTQIPEVVYGDEDTKYSVDYGSLVAVAFKAIQEQQVMINELKAKVAALEAK